MDDKTMAAALLNPIFRPEIEELLTTEKQRVLHRAVEVLQTVFRDWFATHHCNCEACGNLAEGVGCAGAILTRLLLDELGEEADVLIEPTFKAAVWAAIEEVANDDQAN